MLSDMMAPLLQSYIRGRLTRRLGLQVHVLLADTLAQVFFVELFLV